jgi:hypothetical protein
MTNQKLTPLKIFLFFLVFITCYLLPVTYYESFAQDNLELLKESYFKQHGYSAFVQYLKELKDQDPYRQAHIDYYIALSRYEQLRYLEKEQIWDEYFNRGPDYRKELQRSLTKALDSISPEDKLHLYALLLQWRLYSQQQDILAQSIMDNLLEAVVTYAHNLQDFTTVKDIADRLSQEGAQSQAAKIYKVYAQELVQSTDNPQIIKNAAAQAYSEENLSLSMALYDAYIERLSQQAPAQELIWALFAIARDFSFKDPGPNDPYYAEKVFSKIEQISGTEGFNEQMLYLRAYNLEKSKQYKAALKEYLLLADSFPDSPHQAEAIYKAGIINTYILADPQAGTRLFQRLAGSPFITPEVIAAVYQLGLLAQWQEDFIRARQYYEELIRKAGNDFSQRVELAKKRMQEIEEGKDLEFNLKAFLDASLGEKSFDISGIQLGARPSPSAINKPVEIYSKVFVLPESGCMPVETNYLWSGNLGQARPSSEEKQFSTTYQEPGIKEINLVVVSPGGVLARGLEMIEVE